MTWPWKHPPDLVALLWILGEPTPYFVTSSLVLLFCGIVYVNTGFSLSEFRVPSRASFILLVATASWSCAEILKICFGRTRPRLYLSEGVYAFHPFKVGTDFASFPSEHATITTAMAAAFSILIPAYRSTFFLLTVSVAVSLLEAGAHYPSDVAAGMLLGAIVVAWLATMFDRFAIPLRADKSLAALHTSKQCNDERNRSPLRPWSVLDLASPDIGPWTMILGGRTVMRSIIVAAIAAFVIAAIGAVALDFVQEPVDVAFATGSVRL